MARRLLQTPAAKRRRARYRRNKKPRAGKGAGLPKSVIESARAAGKAGRKTLPPSAVKAINRRVRAAKKTGSGFVSIRTAQTAFKGNPLAQKLNSAGLGADARRLHQTMMLK